MNKTKIIRIFSGLLAGGERGEFTHRIHPKHKNLLGLLHSNNAEVSLSFQNQNELEIERLDTMLTDSMELPPAKRIITWNAQLLDCSLITGTICNLETFSKRINLYLYINE